MALTVQEEPSAIAADRTPATWRQWGDLSFLALTYAMVYLLFEYRGNDSHAVVEGRSLFRWIFHQWTISGGDFSHGWIMPLVSLGIVYRSRSALRSAPKGIDPAGALVLCASLLLHWAAYRAQQPRISLIALTGVLWSLPYFLYGRTVARILLFPAAYLLLCFTSYFLVQITFPLRLAASRMSAVMLQGIGIPAVRQGTAIYSTAGGGFQFDVADACSGLRSLVVMTALAAPYAYFTQDRIWRKLVLFALSVPLAMLANALRIVTLGLIAQGFGQEFALRIYHDFSGYLVFVIAVILLASAGSLLQKDFTKWLPSLKRCAISHT